MKLISNTSFGKLCKSKENEFSRRIDYLDWFERVRTNFDKFLKQPLNIGMFAPCNHDGNVLKEPKKTDYQVDVNTKCSGWKYLYDSNDKLIGYYDDRKWHKAHTY